MGLLAASLGTYKPQGEWVFGLDEGFAELEERDQKFLELEGNQIGEPRGAP
jgi:hypothetical protein